LGKKALHLRALLIVRGGNQVCCVAPASYVSGVRRKFSWGGFIQWQMVVICI